MTSGTRPGPSISSWPSAPAFSRAREPIEAEPIEAGEVVYEAAPVGEPVVAAEPTETAEAAEAVEAVAAEEPVEAEQAAVSEPESAV